MSFQIPTAMVEHYRSNVDMLLQQKGSRLRHAVDVKTDIVGKRDFQDQIGATTAQKVTSRHSDTPLMSTPHARRALDLVDYDWADLIDKNDEIRILQDPTSKYVMGAVNAMGRAMDDEIITALTGTSLTGVAGGTSTVLPSSQTIVHGSAGMTTAKLISAMELFNTAEVDEDEEKFIAVSSKQMSDLLNDTEFKSHDYNSVRALVEGRVKSWMGFTFIRSQRLGLSGTTRSCVAWIRSGVRLGIGRDVNIDVTIRPDKRNSRQVYSCMSLGATRLEEEKVVEIECTE